MLFAIRYRLWSVFYRIKFYFRWVFLIDLGAAAAVILSVPSFIRRAR